jgi:hypothetical protein
MHQISKGDLPMMKFMARAFTLQNWLAKLIAWIPPAAGHNIGKYFALKKAFYLTSLEGIPGDYLEFGVFTGSSLFAAMEFSRDSIVPRPEPVRYFGFDSFSGFGTLNENEKSHPFFQDSFFKTDMKSVQTRLRKSLKDKSRLKLIEGFFENTLKDKNPADYGIKLASVILIDCDTFSAATLVFDFIKPTLQEGTIIIIDDFFGYKGASTAGTYGAFLKSKADQPQWTLRRMFDYGYGGTAYIVSK